MSKDENGGPAFPCMPPQDTAAGCATGYPFPDSGMTLRDYFAAKAMQGFAADPNDVAEMHEMAEWSYKWADAMLAERNKKGGQ